MTPERIIAVGSSLWGVEALGVLLGGLPADLKASVCIVQHTSASGPRTLDKILQRSSKLPVSYVSERAQLQSGHVYLAPPDRHLVLDGADALTVHGPRENRSRPAIDVLFRSAAIYHGASVDAVLLTGLLDDGVAGLGAVVSCGGRAFVQDPNDARAPDLPQAAVDALGDAIDIVGTVPQIADALAADRSPAQPTDCPTNLRLEHDLFLRANGIAGYPKFARTVAMACPSCGGPLWQMPDDHISRYRCHVGHGFTAKHLETEQTGAFEEAMWVALRTLDERRGLLEKLARDYTARGHTQSATDASDRVSEVRGHAEAIRAILRQPLGDHPS